MYQKKFEELMDEMWAKAKEKYGDPVELRVDKDLQKVREYLMEMDQRAKSYLLRIDELLQSNK